MNIMFSFHWLIIIFWGTWYILVAFTDMVSIVSYIYKRNYTRFNSRNVELVDNMLKNYNINSRILAIIIVSIITLICFSISFCFFYGCYINELSSLKFFWIKLAFINGLLLHMGFILFDEFFVMYEQQTKHIARVIFLLVSYLTILKF